MATAVTASPTQSESSRSSVRAPMIGATALGLVVLALYVATIPVSRAAHLSSAAGAAGLFSGTGCLVVGVLLATRRPDNAMGWVFLLGALFLGLTSVAGGYSVIDYRLHHPLPLAGVAVFLQPCWAPAIVFFGLSFLIFPDGHFSSRVVKWTTWLVLALGTVWIAGAFAIAAHALVDHAVRLDSSGNLLTIDNPRGTWAWWGVVQDVFFLCLFFSWILWLVLQVPRYRRAGDEERHQMKWLLSGATIAIACGLLAGYSLGNGLLGAIGIAGLVVLPISIAIGATRFHLYAIDRLISRTLAYVLLTGLVVGVYVGVITLATKVIGFSSPVGVATSTLVAAAIFNPLRKRLQRGLDRRFNREHYDAERIVAGFASRVRESVEVSSVERDLIGVLHAAFEPASAGIWTRGRPLAVPVLQPVAPQAETSGSPSRSAPIIFEVTTS